MIYHQRYRSGCIIAFLLVLQGDAKCYRIEASDPRVRKQARRIQEKRERRKVGKQAKPAASGVHVFSREPNLFFVFACDLSYGLRRWWCGSADVVHDKKQRGGGTRRKAHKDLGMWLIKWWTFIGLSAMREILKGLRLHETEFLLQQNSDSKRRNPAAS